MKQTKGFQIWQIIYPVGLYYVVSSRCYFALEILLGSADETYMLRQLVGDAVTIPVILKFYMADQNIRDTVYGKKKFRFSSEQAINIAVTVVSDPNRGRIIIQGRGLSETKIDVGCRPCNYLFRIDLWTGACEPGAVSVCGGFGMSACIFV